MCRYRQGFIVVAVWISVGFFGHFSCGGQTNLIRIATYNLENYILAPGGTRPIKPIESRRRILECLRALNADVIALQEVGGQSALDDIASGLRELDLQYPHSDLITAYDTNIQVAVLSRFPFLARHPHTNDSFLLMGRRLKASRGFLEVVIKANDRYRFTLLTTHLKSKRPVGFADEGELREQEAILLREKIDRRLRQNPDMNLVVLGDFNDFKDSRPIRTILSRGRHALIDTRPSERHGDAPTGVEFGSASRRVTWTHYFVEEDTYSRIDYIFISPGMAREWVRQETFVYSVPDWGVASDHRPITAAFVPVDR